MFCSVSPKPEYKETQYNNSPVLLHSIRTGSSQPMSSGSAAYGPALHPFPLALDFMLDWMQSHADKWLSQTWYLHPNKTICCIEGKCVAEPPSGFFRNWPKPNKSSAEVHLTSHHFVLTIGPERVSCICCPNWPVLGDTARSLHFTSHGTWQHLVLFETSVQVFPHLHLGKHFHMVLK